MKNVVVIVIDALGKNFIGATDRRNTPTPFIDSLAARSARVNNMYSMAPFTEAALIATWGGEKTFENGTGMKSIGQCKELLSEMMKERGYKTISTISPYIYPSAYLRGVDEGLYNWYCQLFFVINYRLLDYKKKHTEHVICDKEYHLCYEILLDSLKQIILINNKIFKESIETSKLKELINIEALKDFNKIVLDELKSLEEYEIDYIKGLFDQWSENPLVTKCSSLRTKIKPEQEITKFLQNEFGDFLLTVDKKNQKLQKKNNNLKLSYLISEINLGIDIIDKLRIFKRIICAYSSVHSYHETAQNSIKADTYAYSKGTISIHSQFDYFTEKIEEYDRKNEPYYAYIHADDFHFPSVFFTYDTNDKDLIREEFERLKKYVNDLPDNYCGNLITDLSAVYIDFHLEKFITSLQNRLKNDVSFIITADHGYSYYNLPPREEVVNNFHNENFAIPFLIYNNKAEAKVLDGLYSSEDTKKFIRKFILNEDVDLTPRKYVTAEWIPGCPDIFSKQCYYSIFDGKYKIAAKVRFNEKIDNKSVISIYDLENDPLEMNNQKKKLIFNDTCRELLQILNERHSWVCEKRKSY